jgi:hypothetical protein
MVKKMVDKKKKKVSQKRVLKKDISSFTIQFIPYSEIKLLDSKSRVKKILDTVSQSERILILQGKLRPEEERELISETMNLVRNVNGFSGIELAVISGMGNNLGSFWIRLKKIFLKFIAGGDLDCVTIIGPASIVKEIKQDPSKIELLI